MIKISKNHLYMIIETSEDFDEDYEPITKTLCGFTMPQRVNYPAYLKVNDDGVWSRAPKSEVLWGFWRAEYGHIQR